MPDPKTRRTSADTRAEILKICRKPTSKTQIMYKTNTSHPATQKFVKHLQKLKLLEIGHDAKKYVTTEEGLEFIRKYAALQDFLKP